MGKLLSFCPAELNKIRVLASEDGWDNRIEQCTEGYRAIASLAHKAAAAIVDDYNKWATKRGYKERSAASLVYHIHDRVRGAHRDRCKARYHERKAAGWKKQKREVVLVSSLSENKDMIISTLQALIYEVSKM